MDSNLRYGAGYEARKVESVMDFSSDHGFSGAVGRCTGVGACRKTNTGAMCPSYMVTNEEIDTTRGRANALRMALSGGLPVGLTAQQEDYIFGDELGRVLDLCVQCKACKTECPTGVDMAAIKSEWLYHHKRRHGWTARDRLFAALPDIARRVAGPLAPLANAVGRVPLARMILHRFLGIERTRPLPQFARRPFHSSDWARATGRPQSGSRVALFVDTFSNYNHPEVASAACDVLTKAGYAVEFPADTICCGRTRISKGDLAGARKSLDRALDALYPLAQDGVRVVGLEPGCLHTFGDEGRRLFPGDPRVDAVADAVVSFEEFVARDESARFGALNWSRSRNPVVVHGHCFQKALEGTGYAHRALGLVSDDVAVLDTACCGMAGSFGYESEHTAVSRMMAERRLAPAVRELSDSGIVVASGSSCRSQIAQVAGRRAHHPAEVLAAALQ